jgi:hypothetical protein
VAKRFTSAKAVQAKLDRDRWRLARYKAVLTPVSQTITLIPALSTTAWVDVDVWLSQT